VDRGKWHRLLSRVRRTLRLERRLTLEESHQLLHLAEAILDHGRMLQSHYDFRMEHVMIEVPELAFRFREKEDTITEALRLLREMGRAERFDRRGRWRLYLAEDATLLSRGSSAGG